MNFQAMNVTMDMTFAALSRVPEEICTECGKPCFSEVVEETILESICHPFQEEISLRVSTCCEAPVRKREDV